MVTLITCIVLLVLGFAVYGRVVEKVFGPQDNQTPAVRINDGVDYVPMKTWKVFLIELLNIAGTGPIFGALSGALFGPVAYLWIVFGCIFGGAVHDYMIGMISVRNDGEGIAELSGKYIGGGIKMTMRIFSIILLVMCGVVFTVGPAELLNTLLPSISAKVFFFIILAYYGLATFVPIDKIIGKIYPVFGALLLIMAVGVLGSLFFSGFEMPELWNNFTNLHAKGTPIFPFLFITIACGAISGFHATQSPIMARCIKKEKDGRFVFYGAMIAEGIIAMIWCAAGCTVFESSQALLDAGAGCSAVAYQICSTTMGKVGCILAILGVIVCPISSGDTAFRSTRLVVADWVKIDQSNPIYRISLTVPILIVAFIISTLDYSVVWRYFSWSNQTLAMIALWTVAEYLCRNGKNWKVAALPAMFMSVITVSYFFAAPECLGKLWTLIGVSENIYYYGSIIAGVIAAVCFTRAFFVHKAKASADRLDQ